VNLFLMDLNDITLQDVADFCQQDFPESVRLDYKRDLSSTNPKDQVVSGVSAFANTQGGVLLYGVGTKPNSQYPDWPSEGMPRDPDFERRVTRWCIEHAYPPIVPFVKWIDNPNAPGKGFGVVRVEPSWHAPHTMDGGRAIYVRRADNSDPVQATLEEIESLRNMRERAIRREDKLWMDLRRRVEVRDDQVGRWVGFLLMPEFSEENAISLGKLPEVARELRSRGLRPDLISTMSSYCDGVLSNELPQWRFALTSKGALGVGHLDEALTNGGVDLDDLAGWAILFGSAGRLLAEEAGHWGRFRISFEAHGYKGVQVVDSRDSVESYRTCRDARIVIEFRTEATLLRAGSIGAGTELFRRIMWSYGQHDRMWTEEQIQLRLAAKKREAS